ncbi:MAG: hypothetical protein DRH57_03440 [Candidatus Cloacimonadota bacterium]|nr:MAG: hypothetical protein DRH57_03440 [Candidatus Cloacimonadota bacterium]
MTREQEDKRTREQENKNGKARNPIIFILDNADKVPDLLYDWMKYLLESEIKDIHFIISSKEHLPEIFELATKEHKNTLKGSSQRHIDIEEKSTIINEFQLQNLTENEIAPFIQNKLTKCEQIPDKVISYLYKQTNGNLFLLNFLLTNFKQENYLQYKDNKWLFTTPDKIINLPESITKLLKNNFASLTLSQQEMLKFLSVFTITLPYDFLLKCVKTSLRQSLSSLTNNAENEIYYLFNSNWLKKEDDFVRFDSDYKKLFIINNYKTDHNKHYYEISSQMLEQYFQQPSSEILQEIAHHYMKTDKFQKSYDYTMLCGDTNENINKKIYWYEKSLQFAKKLDKNKVFKSIHKLMSAYVKNNQFVKAENLIACYLPSYETDKKTFIRLRAYLANIYFKEEKFSEALRIYKDIYDYYLTDLPEKESFDVLDNYTADLTNLGNYDKAKCIIETYLSTEQNLKKVYVARLKNELGIVMYLKNEPDKALKNYFLALQNLNQYEPSQLKGQIFNNIGGVYIKKGDLINADKYYHKAYKIYNQFNVLWLKYSTLINIATINRMLGNFEKARTYWEESLNYFEFKQSILSLSEIHNNLGSLYFYLGDYSKSKYHFQRTLKLYQKQNNPDTMLMTLNNLVELNFLCRDFVEAEKIIAKVIQLAKKRHNIFELAYSYYFLGKIYLEANNKLAEEIFLNSAELFASINEKDEKLKPQIGLYEIYAKNQDAQSMNLFEEITSNITESPELSLLFLCSLIRLHKLDEFMNLMPNVCIQENKLTAENKWQYHFFIGIHNQENNSLEDAIYHYKVAMEIIKEMWDKLDEQSKQNYLNDKLKIELKDRMDRTFCNYSI